MEKIHVLARICTCSTLRVVVSTNQPPTQSVTGSPPTPTPPTTRVKRWGHEGDNSSQSICRLSTGTAVNLLSL
jgi:hypothetical protein